MGWHDGYLCTGLEKIRPQMYVLLYLVSYYGGSMFANLVNDLSTALNTLRELGVERKDLEKVLRDSYSLNELRSALDEAENDLENLGVL